jgi:8-oxo-dGTP diphosphatase
VPELVAAGAVLWRPPVAVPVEARVEARVEVAVVHRPRYDDWSLPKGKPRKGEALPGTAVREVAEETGNTAVLGSRLGSTRYPVAAGEKTAHYWAARSVGGHFIPSEEVDDMRWLPPADAAELLSYPHDRVVLADIHLAASVTGTALLVRHAKAGKREEWQGDDDLRPLTAAGRRQAEALRALLPLFGPTRVYAAPVTRCRQTVERLAADLGVPVIDEPLLSEKGYLADPEAGRRWVIEIAAEPGPPVVCSQGGVIPDVLRRLAATSPYRLAVPDDPPSRKGSFWGLFLGTDRHDSATGQAAPSLLAADYYDDPLTVYRPG